MNEPKECQFCGHHRSGVVTCFDDDGLETDLNVCSVCEWTDAHMLAWRPGDYSPDVHIVAKLISQATNLILEEVEALGRRP